MQTLTEDDLGDTIAALQSNGGNQKKTAVELGISVRQLRRRIRRIEMVSGGHRSTYTEVPDAQDIHEYGGAYQPPMGTGRHAPRWEIKSLPNNIYRFATFGDLHAASKYCRWDVREDLTRRAEKFGAQAIIDTGNWIDGVKPFNVYDLEVIGCTQQLKLLAERYPKTKIPTYAVAGADHEGWFAKSEGIDIGHVCEGYMREAGHPWTNLGFMEADIVLRNAKSNKTAIMRVMHAGGGSAYALSYRPQKIIESFEGGEKPAVLCIGHYHKLDCGLIRNVWYIQTGTAQDQTPFLRSRAIESHVGGVLVELEQDPETGAIISFTPQVRKYYNEEYYFKQGKANNRWSGHGPITQVPRS